MYGERVGTRLHYTAGAWTQRGMTSRIILYIFFSFSLLFFFAFLKRNGHFVIEFPHK